MRTRLLVIVIGGSFVLLAAWSLQLGAAPALAQQTCPAGQTYCPSGAYAGQCRPNTVACPTGSVSATVGGCSTCSCPGGQVVCSGACQAPKSCPDANRSTADQCAATNAASCGACAGGYTLDAGTNTCVLQSPVILAPLSPQERSSDKSAINVVQGGTGLLFNLQTQSGTDSTTRRQILSADKTGLMVGYDPDAAKLGIDLSAAGGQNLLYGIAREAGLDPVLDTLLLLQTRTGEGAIVNRVKVTGTGDLTASGFVRGDELCIGADCKSSWSAVAPAGVLLQNTTPGTQQIGHLNISGTARLGALEFAGGSMVNLQGAQVSNATYIGGGGTPTSPPFLRFTENDLVYVPTSTGNGSGLMVWENAVDPAITGYAKLWHDGTSTYIGDTTSDITQSPRISGPDLSVPGDVMVGSDLAVVGSLDVKQGIQAGSGNVNIINSTGKIPAISSSYFANLDGSNLTGVVRLQPSSTLLQAGEFHVNGIGEVGETRVRAPGGSAWARIVHDGTSVLINDSTTTAGGGLALDSAFLSVGRDVTLGSLPGLPVSTPVVLKGNTQALGVRSNKDIEFRLDDDQATTPDDAEFRMNNGAGQTVARVTESGNVGIGTTLAGTTSKLHVDGGGDNGGPWATLQGGASVLGNIALRLYDAGTADGNVNVLEFAHNGASGPVMVAKIKSTNVGANATSGAKLALETTSNNAGAINTDQLVLINDGNVRMSKDLSLGGGDILIDPGEHLTIRAPNGDVHLGGLARVRAGGVAISDNPNVTVPTRGLSVQDLATLGSVTVNGEAVFNGSATVGGQSILRGRSVVSSSCSTTSCSASCSSGYAVISGGCSTGDGSIRRSYPASYTQWTCERTSSVNTIIAYAICVKL